MSDAQVEALSIFLIRTMGSDLRDYHRPEHSLDVSKVESPVARLAAFFHDLIYVQVDPSWRGLSDLLDPFVPDEQLSLNVPEALKLTQDSWLRAICVMFGVENETQLTPAKGLNEFLSAVVMYHKLSPVLDAVLLFRAVACVIATVPFLGIDAEGKNPAQRLVLRMREAEKILGFKKFSDAFYDEVISECCEIVSTDLASFGAVQFADYISNTWKVMYESYPPLRNAYFLISDYRRAVYGNIHFLETLDSSRLYWNAYSKQGHVDSQLDLRSNYNLRMGQIYLKTVGASLSVLEAIAVLTGGDAPYELFVGSPKRSREHNPQSIDEFLPLPEKMGLSEIEEVVYEILKNGRTLRSRFDSKSFSLGAFLLFQLKWEGILALFQRAKGFHSGSLSAEEFLGSLPREVLGTILKALERVVGTRRVELDRLLKKVA